MAQIKTIKELIDVFDKSDALEFDYEEADFKLHLKKPEIKRKVSGEKVSEIGANAITAPVAGTYVSSKNKIKIGERVLAGQELCTIHAMKIANTISAPYDGIVERINARDGEIVEYGAVLFEIARL